MLGMWITFIDKVRPRNRVEPFFSISACVEGSYRNTFYHTLSYQTNNYGPEGSEMFHTLKGSGLQV